MPDLSFSPQRLAAAYVEATQAALPRITKTFARMIARAFQGATRHVIDFPEETPADANQDRRSELLDTEMPFILENYLTVADFWEEYEGSREPSRDDDGNWRFPTFGDIMQREVPTLLDPHYVQALARLQQEEPTYYGQLVAYIHAEYNDQAQTHEDLLEEIGFNEIVGDAETQCEYLVIEHLQPLLLASLLHKQRLPRCCRRSVLEGITNLSAFMDELAGYCLTVAHATSLNTEGPLQLHIERTSAGVVFGEYEGARELLMDHIAQEGSLILRCTLDGVDDAGTSLAGVRGWFITATATSVTSHRILPDDLYEAMNTDADTGAKLPPEPNVRYL